MPNNATCNVCQLTVSLLQTSSPIRHPFPTAGHRIFTIGYTKTIEIEGGATLTFHGNGQNGRMNTNFLKLVVPEAPPVPQPFNGQFIKLNVLHVTEAK